MPSQPTLTTRVNCGAPLRATTRFVVPAPILTSAVASPPVAPWSMRDTRGATERMSANACRSMPSMLSPAFWATSVNCRIMSRWAATMRTFCLPGPPSSRCLRGEHLEIHHRIVQRDGDGLLRLELDGRAQFLLVDHGEFHGAHHDLLVRDAQAEMLAGEAAVLPERLELRGERRCINDLALEDQALGQRAHGDRGHRVALACALDLCPGDRRLLQVDPDAHSVPGHTRPSVALPPS